MGTKTPISTSLLTFPTSHLACPVSPASLVGLAGSLSAGRPDDPSTPKHANFRAFDPARLVMMNGPGGPGVHMLTRAEVLWHDGVFCCELRRNAMPPQLCLSRFEETVLQIAIGSTCEAHERAGALRILVMNNLAANRWIDA
jgi:hypothetical protein